MAWDPITDIIVDPWDGRADLESGLIRTVGGDPAERFGEDALRLLRAPRFASQLKFSIEPDTLTALSQEAPGLEFVAKERIGKELALIADGRRYFTGITAVGGQWVACSHYS